MSLGVGMLAASGSADVVLPTRSFGAMNYISSSSTTITGPSISIGTASATRRVVLALTYYSPLAVPAVTIGGVAAAFCGSQVRSSTTTTMAFYIATVRTGTTAMVSFTFSGNTYSINYAWWVVNDLLSNTPTDFAGATNATTLTAKVDCLAGGVILAFYTTGYGVSPSTLAWTGVTQDGVSDYGSQSRMAAAGKIQTTDTSKYTVSCAFNYGTSNLMLVMSFR